MSQYFQAGQRVLWNPSTAVAQLFVRTGDALSSLVRQPTGIGPAHHDEYQIDLDAFATFVAALTERYLASTHLILRSLIEGHLATALVMLARAGRPLPYLDARPARDPRDISVGPAGPAPRAETGRLRTLVTAHAHSMPR